MTKVLMSLDLDIFEKKNFAVLFYDYVFFDFLKNIFWIGEEFLLFSRGKALNKITYTLLKKIN